jgi:hypothetical protein
VRQDLHKILSLKFAALPPAVRSNQPPKGTDIGTSVFDRLRDFIVWGVA